MAKRGGRSTKATFPPSFDGEERVVALISQDSFMVGEAQRVLREAIAERHGTEVEVVGFDGKTAELAAVLDELRSVGLMQQRKLVSVDRAEEFVKAHRAALERYAASPEPTATLVLRAEKWHKGNLDKQIEKVGKLCRLEADPSAVRRWISDRAATMHDRKLTSSAVNRLIERLGTDLGKLDSELGKLAAMAEPGGPIEAEHVDAVVGRSSEEDAWRVQDALLSGDAGRAIATLHELNELAGHHEMLLLYACSDLARKLAHGAEMLGRGANEFTVCKTLRVWPRERQRPFCAAARKLGVPGSAAMLDKIVELDARSKSGYGEALENLERFCVLLSERLR